MAGRPRFQGHSQALSDGTGSITSNVDLGLTVTIAIVVTDGGSGILVLSSLGNQVTSGAARMQ